MIVLQRTLLAGFCALLVVSCGGGGGGSGGDGGGGVTPPTTTEPAAPTVSYGGNRNLADLDKVSAVTFASAAVAIRPLMQLAESLWLPRPDRQVNETVTGTGGGSADITGNVNESNVGYIQVLYKSFTENGITLDGRYIQRFRAAGSPSGGFIFSSAGVGTMEFDNLGITTAAGVLRLHGVLRVSGRNRERFEMNLLVDDSTSGESWYYENAGIDFSTVDDRFGLELRGTVYEAVQGGAEIAPTEPILDLELLDTVGYPVAFGGGGFRLESAGPVFELRALSPAFAALLVDADGDGTPDEGTRISWTALEGLPDTVAPISSGPIANAGIDTANKIGIPVTVSALYSHDGEGDWVSYSWSLAAQPLGSQVELLRPSMPEQTIVPDVEGDYVLTLTVSDGESQSIASVRVLADDRVAEQPSLPPVAALEVAPPFAVAAPVRVDARAASLYPLNTMQWSSEGSGVRSITETSDPFVRDFNADSPAVYTVNTRIQSGPGSSVSFAVGGAYQALPTDWLEANRGCDFLPNDFNGDGIGDLAVRIEGSNIPAGQYGFQLMEGLGGGQYLAHPVLEAGGGEVASGDLNGDGLADFAVSGVADAFVSLQQPGGSFAAFTRLAMPGSDCPSGSELDIDIADIDGDGLDDLVAVKPCDTTVHVWRQQPGGDLAVPELAYADERVQRAVFTDVDADGRTDLVLLTQSYPVSVLIIATGQADGTFAFRESLDDADGKSSTGFGTGDFNADGRTDIVRVSGAVAWLHEQQAGGTWQQRSLGTVENIATRANVAAVKVADVDDDGDQDLLLCEQGRELWVGVQQPDGSFVYTITGDCRQGTVGMLNSMAAMDVNGDGYTDIVSNSDSAFRNMTNQDLFARIYLGGLTGYSRRVP